MIDTQNHSHQPGLRLWLALSAWLTALLLLAPAASAERGVIGAYQFGTRLENECVGSNRCPQEEPGDFVTPLSIAVNGTGAGGAVAGDMYLGDFRGAYDDLGNRIQQFSLTQAFKRLWGTDVVKEGPGNSDELQQLMIQATGGTFTLGFGADTTPALAYNASAAAVQAALDALGSITDGAVTVTGGPGDASGSSPYLIAFGGTMGGTDQPRIAIDDSALSGGAAEGWVTTVNPGATGAEICRTDLGDVCKNGTPQSRVDDATQIGGAVDEPIDIAIDQANGNLFVIDLGLSGGGGKRINVFSASGQFLRAFGGDVVRSGAGDSDVDEVQELTVSATGGTFTLCSGACLTNFGNPNPAEFTAPIPYDATSAQVKAALETQPGISGNGGSVTVTGGPGGSNPYVITYKGALGGDDVVELRADATNLAGGSQTAAVTTLASGGGYEVCTANDACKAAVDGDAAGYLSAARSIAVAPAGAPNAGNVLVADNSNYRIQEFTAAGTLVRAIGWDVVATGPGDSAADEFEVCTPASGDVCKAGVQGGATGQFQFQFQFRSSAVAEDSNGAIYVVDSGRLQKFTPQVGPPVLSPSTIASNDIQELTVNAGAGQFRLSFGAETGGTTGLGDFTQGSDVITNVETTTGAFTVGERITTACPPVPNCNAVLPNADVFITAVTPGTLTISAPATASGDDYVLISNLPYETPNIPHNAPPSGPGSVEEALNALPSIGAGGGSVSVTGGPGAPGGGTYTIEFDSGPVAGTDVEEIEAMQGSPALSGGSGAGANTATVATAADGGPQGSGFADAPFDVAVAANDHVFVAKRYPAGFSDCPDGIPSPREVRIQEFDPSGTLLETSLPCTDVPAPDSSDDIVGFSLNPIKAEPYTLQDPSNRTEIRVSVFGELGPAPELTLDPVGDVTRSAATLTGTIDPNGPDAAPYPSPPATTYQAEYKKASESQWAPFGRPAPIGTGDSPIAFNLSVAGLAPKTEYEVRLRIVKPYTSNTTGPVQSFTTLAAPPTIDSQSAVNVTASSADLRAQINPLGTATSYHFEYGTTRAYGQSTPEVAIGDSHGAVAVEAHIEGLDPVVHHFRVVATNEAGTTTSANQTFNFYPEPCPNATARQQSGSGALPDCRAYELVSPGNAGSTVLIPGGAVPPKATSPSRFPFSVFIGSLQGSGDPFGTYGDLYVATRGDTGWRTRYVGLGPTTDTTAIFTWGPPYRSDSGGAAATGTMFDERLSRFVQWAAPRLGSAAGYLFDAEGNSLGRLPTNAAEVPGAMEDISIGGFAGDFRPAGDFSHFFFSSANLAFAPGGLTSGTGSAYDNDLRTGAVTIASKTPAGGDIPREPGPLTDGWLELPAVSEDGSHLLMSSLATGVCGRPLCGEHPFYCGLTLQTKHCKFGLYPGHLYMRVDGAVSYDVSAGHVVDFVGMTDDGSQVLFTSDEQITADDTDTSTDLYRWSEAGDQITRLSKGELGSAGDRDGCNAEWVAKCGIVVPQTAGSKSDWRETDHPFGTGSGAAYFYSPEQLVPGEGIPGARNLYVAREGTVQFVAALSEDKPASRLQVTPSGDHAAFLSDDRLTGADNGGFEAMYLFDAEAEELICASCRPSGEPPSADAMGARNGLYIADDGRTFFFTADGVVPADTNEAIDVYEYVNGRPQLITPGSGDAAPDSESPEGLIGISGNGTDVYFATFETLVPEDENGPNLKFYDARVNGGFPRAAVPAPCAAADECHGVGGAAPAPPRLASSAPLGRGGNLAEPRKRQPRRGRCTKRARKAAEKKGKRCVRAKRGRDRSGRRAGR